MRLRLPRVPRWRPLAAAALWAVLAPAALAQGAKADPQAAAPGMPRAVQDPHYGDGLFHFFQDRYFSAITGLMVSQQFRRVPQHADEAELLRGGMLLSYGLHEEAGAIFEQLLQRQAAPAVRDRAWFFLAKIRYQRGFQPQAEAALARIERPLAGGLEEDRALLRAQLLMARGAYAEAAAALEPLASANESARYARYNLGVALVRAGDTARGSALLQALGTAPAADEEARVLRDKANVALGYAALREQRAQEARGHLERVRLHGPQSSKALLGFGWAALALDAPQQALVPFAELAGREGRDAASLEVRLALPHAQAALGARAQALAGYQAAIAAFEREDRALDESIAAIRAGKLVEGLLQHNPGEEMGWFWKIESLPAMPHAEHLTAVLAEHDFQEAFKNWRDLRFLAGNLAQWQDKLGVYGDMLATRRQAYAQRLPRVLDEARRLGITPLEQRREALAAELAQALDAADGRAFADERQQALAERLARVQATLQALGDDPAAAAARERARRAAGALTWALARDDAQRSWEARKALAETDRELAAARAAEAGLQQAQRDEPARFEAFQARIDALGPRLAALAPQVQALGLAQQQALQELAVASLQSQKSRLAGYTLQARLAVAQLYDRATVTRSEADAPAR